VVSVIITSVPDLPPSTVDNIRQSSVLDNNTGIVPPWTAEIVNTRARRTIDVGVIDDVVGGVGFGVTAAGCHCTCADGVDVAVLEPGNTFLAEDEVNSALNVGVDIELVSLLSEERVYKPCE
jgi:hypothetical protein